MGDKLELSWEQIDVLAEKVVRALWCLHGKSSPYNLYGVPRGGVYAAQAVKAAFDRLQHRGHVKLVEEINSNSYTTIIIDDIIDCGRTLEAYKATYNFPFMALVDKRTDPAMRDKWIVFPWEKMNNEQGAEENIVRILQYIGEDPAREGLQETPKRVLASWDKLYGGYKQDPASILKVFEDGACDEMVVLKNIEFYSTCEHHMIPFSGRAHIAYIPDKKIVGISKLARLLEIYARRLQVQERLCQQVTMALDEHLKPLGSACILEAQHMCLTGDSLVRLAFLNHQTNPRGVPIKELVGKNGLFVYCYDEQNKCVDVKPVNKVWSVGKKQVFKVSYEWFVYNQHKKIKKTGYIKVTEDHPFMLRKTPHNHYNNKNRQYKNGTYLSIKDGLSVGDSLMPFSCEGVSYKTIFLNNGTTESEHRFLLANKIGRALKSFEVCHHKNENPLDNTYDNLELISSKGLHSKKHQTGISNPKKSHVPLNKKERTQLICHNCNTPFTVRYAYMEKTRKYCSRACSLEVQKPHNHRIISIEKMGVEDVFDMEVQTHHNFAVNDIIVHNCMTSRGIEKQNSIMVTSSLTGVFKTQVATRTELLSMIKG